MSKTLEFTVIDALSEEQILQLHALFRKEWWTSTRELPAVRRMLKHSDHLVGLAETGSKRLLAFARILTDTVFKAFVFDCIVDPEFRKRGLGEALMERILTHPELKPVHHFELYCLPELEPFYHRFGFRSDLGSLTLMRREAPPPDESVG